MAKDASLGRRTMAFVLSVFRSARKHLRSRIKSYLYQLRHPDVSPRGKPAEIARLPALKCTIAYNQYGAYCVPLSSRHRPAAKAILDRRIWEPGTLKVIAELYRGGKSSTQGRISAIFCLRCRPSLRGAMSTRASRTWRTTVAQESRLN